MRPTRLRLLLGIGLAAGLLTWAVLHAYDSWHGGLPAIRWTAPATLVLLDVALLATVLAVRPRLLRRPGAKPMPPLLAARFAALALACSRVGAAIAGGYLGFVAALLGELDTSYGRQRAVYAGLSVLAAVGLVALALILERACRIPADRPGDDGGLGSAA